MWLFQKYDELDATWARYKDLQREIVAARRAVSSPPEEKPVGPPPPAVPSDGWAPFVNDPRRIRFLFRGPGYRKAYRKLRAYKILNRRIMGYSVKAIGQELKLSPKTIRCEIDWAKREGLFEEAREKALGLGNKALRVYEKALDMALQSGDIEAARDVVQGLGIFTKDGRPPITAVLDSSKEGMIATLEEYRVRRMTTSVPHARAEEAAIEPAIDAEVVVSNEEPTSDSERDTSEDASGTGAADELVATRPGRTRALLPSPAMGDYPPGS